MAEARRIEVAGQCHSTADKSVAGLMQRNEAPALRHGGLLAATVGIFDISRRANGPGQSQVIEITRLALSGMHLARFP
jgi:hypothetical protein